jgi:hypothetical protein
MDRQIKATEDGRIALSLDHAEVAFLAEMVEMLEGVGDVENDPGEARLNVPAYLGDVGAADEFRQLMGDQIEDGRARDRKIMRDVLAADSPAFVDHEQALGILRVVNESRLVLAARLGIEVESDYETLDVAGAVALHYLGLFLEDLTHELAELL